MPRVVPSDVVTAIDQLFPQTRRGGDIHFFRSNRPEMLTLLGLIGTHGTEAAI
jgi:hypothetical protein